MESILKNGSTSKSQSQLSNQSVPVSGRVSADLDAEIAEMTAKLKLKKQQRDAENVARRESDRQKKAQKTADELYGLKCRIYRAFHAATAAGQTAMALDISNEFRTNSVDQQFSLKAMDARRDAARVAAGEAAKATLAQIAAE